MIKKKRVRPTYSTEFKAEAVAKCLEVGACQTSKELGIPYVTLRNWVTKAGQGLISAEDKPSYEDLERENNRLKKELGYVNEINKVLKKSTRYSQAERWEVCGDRYN